MPTSKTPPNGAPPQGGAPSSYTKFIPREELGSFSAWSPDSLQSPGNVRPAPGESPAGGGVHKPSFADRVNAQSQANGAGVKVGAPAAAAKPGVAAAAKPEADAKPKAPAPPTPEAIEKLKRDARQSGYQDGYRDGLAALESYKQTQTAQMAAFMSEQVGAVVSEMQMRLETVEQQLSGRIAGVALELARQVVRSEIALRPELVVTVAEEALNTLLETAKHVSVRMNPKDLEIAQPLLQERLEARGVRAVADPAITVGGCMVESDIAAVDATVEARWQHAASAMGLKLAWHDHEHAPVPVEEGDDDETGMVWPEEVAPDAGAVAVEHQGERA